MKKVSVHHVGVLKDMDATSIAENIRKKEISIQEVMDCLDERIEIANPKINAIAFSSLDNRRIVNPDGIFAGVPMFIKDLVDVENMPTYHGSEAFSGKLKRKNSKGVEQIAAAGFVVVGKSTTSEYGFSCGCETIKHGNTLNPINTDYSTGGSSGGAGALVGSGIVPIAHAMDGGGSIRIPASNCGLIGLKPSRGRILGSYSEGAPIDVTCDGVLTNTVRDTANFLYSAELYHSKTKLPKIGWVKDPLKRKLKIAMLLQGYDGLLPDKDVKDATEKTALILQELGHNVEQISNPLTPSISTAFHQYFSFLAYMNNLKSKMLIDFSFNVKKNLTYSNGLSDHFIKNVGFQLFKSIELLRKNIKMYNDVASKFDVILSPVLPTSPKPIGFFGAYVSYDDMIERMVSHLKFTPIHNLTGNPSISLPMNKSIEGLPIGSLFSAIFGNEKLLLELAFEIEQSGFLLKHSSY